MDEAGQPDSEPAGVGDEPSATPAGGWQPNSNGAYRDLNGSRPDSVRRAPGIRTADSPWSSAGAALEPTMEPASTGWRRSLTSGLRGRAEVRSRYADLLAPVSPAVPPTNPRAGEVPASAPPYPYEGDLEGDQPHRAWAAPPQIPAERPAPRPEIEPYHAYRPNGALVDNTFEDLPAVAAQAAAASKAAQAAAQAASAVQAARAAEAAAEAQAVVEDHAAVEAAYRAAVTQGGTDTPAPPNGAGPARVEPRHPAAFRPPADFRPPAESRAPGGNPTEHRAPGNPAEFRPPGNPTEHRAPSNPTEHRAPGNPAEFRPPGNPTEHRAPSSPTEHRAPSNRAEFRPPGSKPAEFRAPGSGPAEFRPPTRPPVDGRTQTDGRPSIDGRAPVDARPPVPAPSEFRPPSSPPAQLRPLPRSGPEPARSHAEPAQPARPAVRGLGEVLRQPPNGPDEPRRAAREESVPPPPRNPADQPGAMTAGLGYPPARASVPVAPAQPRPVPPIEPISAAPSPLPQRIPAPPDVPEVPEDEPEEQLVGQEERTRSGLAPPELARIATHLRYDEDLEEQPADRSDGFDVNTVLAAVRLVPGVRDAQLRPNPGGVHTLRLDLADGADPGQVSRLVARLLKQKMGLAAEPRRQQSAGQSAPRNIPRDPGGPVAGAAPAPRTPVPAGATEQPGGPAAANAAADERSRHRVTPVRGRDGHGEGEAARRPVRPGAVPRVQIDQVQVSTLGLDATVEVRLTSNGSPAYGVASGPAVDGYVLRLAAVAATNAIDQLLTPGDGGEQQGRSFVEHAAVVPFGSCEVAVVVILLVYGGTVEQLAGSALVAGDPRQAVVRATLAAVNRRLDALLT